MSKFDDFFAGELQTVLDDDERVAGTAFLFNKSLGVAALLGPLAMLGGGYFFAAVTNRRLLLAKTSMGLLSLKRVNQGWIKIPLGEISSITRGGMANQKRIKLSLQDGSTQSYKLNTIAKIIAGQKQFIDALCQRHAEAQQAVAV